MNIDEIYQTQVVEINPVKLPEGFLTIDWVPMSLNIYIFFLTLWNNIKVIKMSYKYAIQDFNKIETTICRPAVKCLYRKQVYDIHDAIDATVTFSTNQNPINQLGIAGFLLHKS